MKGLELAIWISAAGAMAAAPAPAQGCPWLGGTYACGADFDDQVIEVSQRRAGGVTSYIISGFAEIPPDEIRADNITYPLADLADTTVQRDGTMRSWCENGSLKTMLTFTLTSEGASLYVATMNEIRLEGDDLVRELTGTISMDEWETEFAETVSCGLK